MTVLYERLPQQDRRAAEQLAETLIRNTPAAPKSEFSGTLRDALDTAFIKSENVVAAFEYYDEGDGSWMSFIAKKENITFNVPYRVIQDSRRCLV
jgi:hypothetical protein